MLPEIWVKYLETRYSHINHVSVVHDFRPVKSWKLTAVNIAMSTRSILLILYSRCRRLLGVNKTDPWEEEEEDDEHSIDNDEGEGDVDQNHAANAEDKVQIEQ